MQLTSLAFMLTAWAAVTVTMVWCIAKLAGTPEPTAEDE